MVSTHEWPPSGDFWASAFPAATSGGVSPHLFKGLIPPHVVGVADVLEGFGRICAGQEQGEPAEARFRIYVGEERRDDLIPVARAAAGATPDTFVAAMQHAVQAERFSLVINNLESVSDRLAAAYGDLLRSAFRGLGVPIGGCEQAAFIGNYSGTAFGVHEGYEDAFLTHLGPGTKHFYCWEHALYSRLTGDTKPMFGDYDWLLPHGECFDMEPGDVLFLPKRVFHVGRQSEFSVSVALPLYTYPSLRLVTRALLPDVAAQILEDSFDPPSPFHDRELGPLPIARQLSAVVTDVLKLISSRLDELLAPLVEDRWYSILSNGGWEVLANDLARDDAHRVAEAVVEGIRPGVFLSLAPPYEPFWAPVRGDAGVVDVWLRGQKVALQCQPDLEALLAGLAAGREIQVPDDATVVEALRQLFLTGGLRTLPGPSTPENRDSEGLVKL
jgi:hypothetical protein